MRRIQMTQKEKSEIRLNKDPFQCSHRKWYYHSDIMLAPPRMAILWHLRKETSLSSRTSSLRKTTKQENSCVCFVFLLQLILYLSESLVLVFHPLLTSFHSLPNVSSIPICSLTLSSIFSVLPTSHSLFSPVHI